MTNPRDIARMIDKGVGLPSGTEERFSGYGLMGLPFSSGHILGLRCFPASSLGTGYSSVWHRNPEGDWVFYQNVPPHLSCPRYFGSDIVRAVLVNEVRIAWSGTHEFRVTIDGIHRIDWQVSLATTPSTWMMNAMAKVMPDPLWRRSGILQIMGGFAGMMLGAGRLGLTGKTPNGQSFMAAPRLIWSVATSNARIKGEDLGPTAPLHTQARLGDFWIPQRGIFAVGGTRFDVFDPALHVLKTSRMDTA